MQYRNFWIFDLILSAEENRKGRVLGQMSQKLPAHELVYQQLREMVLFGDIAPGQAVTIQGLIGQLGVGMTPVREAIRRLTAEGALQALGNRRIVVPQLAVSDLEQLAFARLAIEPRLAELSVKYLTDIDIVAIEQIDSALNIAIENGDVTGYLRENYRFHMAIYDASHAPLLTDLARGLWLRFGPSLRVVCGRFGTQNLPDRHRQALDAMRDRDAGAAAQAIREDLEQGFEQVRHSLRV